MRALLLSFVVLPLGLACGSADLKSAGEQCFGTTDCAEGLTCDFGQDPSICSSQQSGVLDAGTPDANLPLADADPTAPDAAPVPDAAATPDAAIPDAAVPDAAIPDAALPDAALADAQV